MSNKIPREVWNEQTERAQISTVKLERHRNLRLNTNTLSEECTYIPSGTGSGNCKKVPQDFPTNISIDEWHFINTQDKPRPLRFEIEAVVVDNAPRGIGFTMSTGGNVDIAAAKKQPGAIYLRKTLDLNH